MFYCKIIFCKSVEDWFASSEFANVIVKCFDRKYIFYDEYDDISYNSRVRKSYNRWLLTIGLILSAVT